MKTEKTGSIDKGQITYICDSNGCPVEYLPWLHDCFAFLYDGIMDGVIYPKKLNSSRIRHIQILRRELNGFRGNRILEIGTGSGNAVEFLDSSNAYTGMDISPGLLKKAVKRFHRAGFQNSRFLVSDGTVQPFSGQSFDFCICLLTLNFIPDLEAVLKAVRQDLKQDGFFFGSVPVPERNINRSKIRGTLRTVSELSQIFERCRFAFEPLADQNGALLYFKAHRQSE